MFQSSLRPRAERNLAEDAFRIRFIVSILAPPESGAQPYLCERTSKEQVVSILAPPESGAQLRKRRCYTMIGYVSILAPPESGAQRPRAGP